MSTNSQPPKPIKIGLSILFLFLSLNTALLAGSFSLSCLQEMQIVFIAIGLSQFLIVGVRSFGPEIESRQIWFIGLGAFFSIGICLWMVLYNCERRLETEKNLATARAIHETLEGIHAADAKRQQAIKDEHDRKAILESGKSFPQ